MTSPKLSYSTDYGRFYQHPTMSRYQVSDARSPYAPKPSITNVIGMLDKSFLPRYYAKLVAEYAVSNLETVKMWRDKFGDDAAIGSLKAVVNQPNRNASIGDNIHAAIDAWCKDEPIPEFETTTAAAMFNQWKNFVAVVRPEIIRSEFTVWSYKHGYAGTGDLMLRTADGDWIIDTKSGNAVHPEVAMQTAALANADVILDDEGSEHRMPDIDLLGVLHIRPRSAKLYRLQKTDEAWEAFLACKRLFEWRQFDADLVLSEAPFITMKGR